MSVPQGDGWFREVSSMWPGQAMSYEIDSVLHQETTEFQELSILKSKTWGTIMVLDGAVQLTDRDEFVYHEMMAHTALRAHKDPRDVLIIGGGDGGVLREVLKYPSIKSCTLVDIDGAVIESSKKYFPHVSSGFADPRATTIVGDGAAFVGDKTEQYDVVIVDSSDPEGPASVLFGAQFYTNVFRSLKPGGIVCSQGESIWLHEKLIATMMAFLRHSDIGFLAAQYAMIYIPSYPCGSIGALLARKGTADALDAPMEGSSAVLSSADEDSLRYYTPAVHRAAFQLPKFAGYLNR